MEKKLKHLEMIQGIINRMGSNSFHLKGWSVILVSALFALAVKNTQIHFVCLAYFPAIAFWILDGYFLRQERLFRELYSDVATKDEADIDFSMDTSPYTAKVDARGKAAFSTTLVIFHGAIIGTILIVMVFVFVSLYCLGEK